MNINKETDSNIRTLKNIDLDKENFSVFSSEFPKLINAFNIATICLEKCTDDLFVKTLNRKEQFCLGKLKR